MWPGARSRPRLGSRHTAPAEPDTERATSSSTSTTSATRNDDDGAADIGIGPGY